MILQTMSFLGLLATSFALAHGGSSDGTGNFFTPSEQQVVDAVAPAIRLARNVYGDFGFSFLLHKEKALGKVVPTSLRSLISKEFDYAVWSFTEDANLENKENPYPHIDFRKQGMCPGPH